MPRLHELQRHFAAALLNHGDAAFSALLHDGRYAGERLLQVYRNNVFASLSGALAAVYPVVAQLVGDGFFAYAADSYIRRHPSRHGNLHDFGDALPGFLAEFPAAAGLAYLPDVARLEWARHRAFHAAAHAALDVAALGAVAADQHPRLRFALHPTASLVASDFPVASIWLAHQADRAENAGVDLGAGGEQVLVIRPRNGVEVVRLDRAEYALLRSLARDEPLDRACDAACALQPEFDLAGTLQKHVRNTTLVAFYLPPPGGQQ